MRVGIRTGVLWPRAWTYPGTCNVASSKCTGQLGAAFRIVDADFPCDRRDTDTRELCITPTALIQAPSEIDSCPGTSLTLDVRAARLRTAVFSLLRC